MTVGILEDSLKYSNVCHEEILTGQKHDTSNGDVRGKKKTTTSERLQRHSSAARAAAGRRAV